MNDTLNRIKLFFIPCQGNFYRPKFLDGNFLIYFVIFLLLSKLVIFSLLSYLPRSGLFADVTKTALIEFTNKERQSLGIKPLESNPELDKAARDKAEDMIKNGYFSHNSPKGITPWFWIKKAGYNYISAGENLAIGFIDSEELFEAWNDSFSHRKNLVNPKYKDIGIAVVKGQFRGKETYVVVQLFGYRNNKASASGVNASTGAKQGQINGFGFLSSETSTNIQTSSSEGVKISKAVAGTEVNLAPRQNLKLKAVKFLTINYPKVLGSVIMYLAILVALVLLLTIFIKIRIQYVDLLLRALFIFLVLSIFIFFDKADMIEFISHSGSIF